MRTRREEDAASVVRRFVRLAALIAAAVFAVWIELLATSFLTSPAGPLPLAGDFVFVHTRWDMSPKALPLPTEATWTSDESPAGVRPDFAH